MSMKNLTMTEWMTITNYTLYPDEWVDVPDWLEDNAADIAVYLKAQMGAKVILKEVDPDDSDSQAKFSDWWEMQIGSFMMAHNYEYSKKYAVLQKVYEYDQNDGSYHKEGSNTYTPDETRETAYDSSNTFRPDSYIETTHTNDIVTHSERVYDDDTITPISTDEHGGSMKVSTKSGTNGDVNSKAGTDTLTISGENVTDYDEDMIAKRSPQDAIEAERRIASYSLIIDVAEAICKAVCFASWEV